MRIFFVEPATTEALKAFVATKVKKGNLAQRSSFNKQNYCQTCSAPVVECSCFCFRTNNITWPNKLNAKNTSNINRTGHNFILRPSLFGRSVLGCVQRRVILRSTGRGCKCDIIAHNSVVQTLLERCRLNVKSFCRSTGASHAVVSTLTEEFAP